MGLETWTGRYNDMSLTTPLEIKNWNNSLFIHITTCLSYNAEKSVREIQSEVRMDKEVVVAFRIF